MSLGANRGFSFILSAVEELTWNLSHPMLLCIRMSPNLTSCLVSHDATMNSSVLGIATNTASPAFTFRQIGAFIKIYGQRVFHFPPHLCTPFLGLYLGAIQMFF